MKQSLIPAKLSDLETLLPWIESYYRFDHIAFESTRLREGVRKLLSHDSYGQAWFLKNAEKVIGYAILTFGFDAEFGGPIGTITDFYIEEASRGRGLGSAALEEIFKFGKKSGLTAIELQAEQDNLRAQAIYKKAGFKELSRIPMIKYL